MLASQLGRIATLVWFADGGHCLYDRIPQWTAESAEWLDAIGKARVGEGGQPPIDNARQLAEIGRDVIAEPTLSIVQEDFDDELHDYARLVTPNRSNGDEEQPAS